MRKLVTSINRRKSSIWVLVAFLFLSCNNWLDVRPKNETTAEDAFNSLEGFHEALTGCYTLLKGREVYGENLTMSGIEYMAQLWQDPGTSYTEYYLMNFDYASGQSEAFYASVYNRLYNIIAQANMILHYVQTNGAVVKNPKYRDMIEAEALAIRALCHFDVMRLFGQLPQGGVVQVSLPYAEKVSRKELPAYYTDQEFRAKINTDLTKAMALLQQSDPILQHTFEALNTNPPTDFEGYRQQRFNYWAVKGLLARFYLYTGDNGKAYQMAKELVEAKGSDGQQLLLPGGIPIVKDPQTGLSRYDYQKGDFAKGYLALPGECLFMLNVRDLMSYVPSVFGTNAIQMQPNHRALPADRIKTVFPSGSAAAASNRRPNLYLWRTNIPSAVWDYPGILFKYNYDVSKSNSVTKNQVVPMIRLSEMYLIAMETTTDLAEANNLYSDYMLARQVQVKELGLLFSSIEAVRTWVYEEYLREFFGEGLMFYTYKRHYEKNMKWRNKAMTEKDYIVPLPNTEFDTEL